MGEGEKRLVTTIFQNVFLIRSKISSIILDTMKLVFVQSLNFVKFTFFLALWRVFFSFFFFFKDFLDNKLHWYQVGATFFSYFHSDFSQTWLGVVVYLWKQFWNLKVCMLDETLMLNTLKKQEIAHWMVLLLEQTAVLDLWRSVVLSSQW